MNLTALRQRDPDSPALLRYAHAGRVLSNDMALNDDTAYEALLELLNAWTQRLALPRLSDYGMKETDIPRVVANCHGSSMKTNPIVLTDAEIAEILKERL